MYKITLDLGAASELQKRNCFTWAMAFVFLSLSHVLNILWRYAISDEFWVIAVEDLAVLFVNMALLLKVVHTEYHINSYKLYKGYYFSFVALGLTLFTSILTPNFIKQNELYATIYLILLTIGGSIFPIIFLYLAIKLEGKERRTAIIILVGAFLLLLGLLFQPHNVSPYLSLMGITLDQWVFDTLLISSPITMILGTFIIYRTYIKSL